MEFIPIKQLEFINKATKTTGDLPPGGSWRTVNGSHIYIKEGKVLAGPLATKTFKAPEGKITRAQAKKVHNNLPPGGSWRTIKGHHAYLDKYGKVLAGAFAGKTKPVKSTKAHIAELQKLVDKEKKPATPKKPTKGAKASAVKPKKPATSKKPAKDTKNSAAKPKPPAKPKKPKVIDDIRSEAQKNKQMSYDVGTKIGGAKKDIAALRKEFATAATQQGLADIETNSPEVAQLMCTKKNILVPVDYQRDFDNGVEANVAALKDLIYRRIAPKPEKDTPEERAHYLNAIKSLQRSLEPIKTFTEMRSAIREGLRDRMRMEGDKALKDATREFEYANKEYNREPTSADLIGAKRIWHDRGVSREDYTPEEWKAAKLQRLNEVTARIKQIRKNDKNPYSVLGDKLMSFFTNYESTNRTMDTLAKKQLTWDKLLNTAQDPKVKKPSGTKVKWEREMPATITRTGGRKTTVKKPEDMAKAFNFRGVEFGHYVDDHAGTFHLVKAAEAFSDLADHLGIAEKDISLNGKLGMAFGARGSGPALAHYEPSSKVINITKNGGAGSLCHEWGHALDNIMYQYSNGGKGSLSMASEGGMGDEGAPEIKQAYKEVMDTIRKGTGGGIKHVENRRLSFYTYNTARRAYVKEHGAAEAIKKYVPELESSFERRERNLQDMRAAGHFDTTMIDKKIKNLKTQLTKDRNTLIQAIANDHFRITGEYLDKIPVPTGDSEYLTRMRGLDGSGKPYWASGCEMFARVFESMVQDQMKVKGLNNDYLVHGTKADQGGPFPKDKERKLMHSAMDKLIKAIVKHKAIQKALAMELIKSLENYDRNTYNIANASEVFFIPVNRLKTPYQTDYAVDWDKVNELMKRMAGGENLDPVQIGYDYDIHDGHHRYVASKMLDYTHVPCVVVGSNDLEVQRAKDAYSEVWKSFYIFDVSKTQAQDLQQLGASYRADLAAWQLLVKPASNEHKRLVWLTKSLSLLTIEQ